MRIVSTIIFSALGMMWAEKSVSAARFHQPSAYTSARALLLRARDLPRGYGHVRSFVQQSISQWDGGIRPIMAVDESNGWLEAAQETMHDGHGKPAAVSVQLFRDAGGARRDFAAFFTNAHPETVYMPGAEWLGGYPITGLGRPATIFRTSDSTSGCPGNLSAGIAWITSNALFNVRVCLRTVGETGARDLARRLSAHSRGR